MCEDQQITTSGFGVCVCHGQVCAAQVCASVQPKDVHSMAILRLFGVEGIPEARLSQVGSSVVRHARSLQVDRADEGSALHDLSKGGSTVAPDGSGASLAGLDRSSRGGGSPAQKAHRHGGAGWDRIRVASCEHLLRAATRNRGEIRGEIARADLSPIPKGRDSLRLRESHDSCRGAWSRTLAGLPAFPRRAGSSTPASPRADARGRCRLRQRSIARIRAQCLRHPNVDSAADRPSNREASQRLLATPNEVSFAYDALHPTMAGRNR